MAGSYANFANITFSPYEFTITFARVDHERDQREDREDEERKPRNSSQNVVAGEVRELVGDCEAHLGVREAAVEKRVPEEDALRGTDADGERIHGGRRLTHVLHADERSTCVLAPFEAADVGAERRPAGR